MKLFLLLASCISLFALLLTPVHANTEKVIFLAPENAPFPLEFHPSSLRIITPEHPVQRQRLPVAFPTPQRPHGEDLWYLLQPLRPQQRYEVRVCWAAIQPTTVDVDVFKGVDIVNDPALFEASGQFSHDQREEETTEGRPTGSFIFLRIRSAADFYSTNKTLMNSPPPVDVDIILDPFLANIFPKSLLPTAAYIVCLAIGSWHLSSIIWSGLNPTTELEDKTHKE